MLQACKLPLQILMLMPSCCYGCQQALQLRLFPGTFFFQLSAAVGSDDYFSIACKHEHVNLAMKQQKTMQLP